MSFKNGLPADRTIDLNQGSAPAKPEGVRTIGAQCKKIAGRAVFCLFLWWFNASAAPAPAQFPADVAMNKGAGSGTWLIVKLQFGGEELPFLVDTGSPITLFDQSLESKLGKRLGDAAFTSPAGGNHESGIYLAPKLYLGGAQLATDPYVVSYPFHSLSARSHQHIMGVLGMDCLRHYCVQLDFQGGTMRFLGSAPTNTAELGKAFPIIFSSKGQNFEGILRAARQNDNCPFLEHTGLLPGTSTNLGIDTGDNVDGAVEKAAIRGHYSTRIAHFFFGSRALRLPECVWDGESYTQLRVNAGKDANRLGLRFLARHVVTFDFPKSTLYLKKTSTGPLSAGKTGEESKPSRLGARKGTFVLVAQQGGSIVIEGTRY